METAALLLKIQEALENKKLLPTAFQNLKKWLTNEDFSEFSDTLKTMIQNGEFDRLNDSFYTTVPFGTGGRRGPIGVGPNRMNFRTVSESAQGLANYLHRIKGKEAACTAVIAYDTRHYSYEFATRTAEILTGNHILVYLFDRFRSTPELSFAVRKLNADTGIVISASHNPPADNGFKVYWSDGGQIVPPHDEGIVDEVNRVEKINRVEMREAQDRGLLQYIGKEIDEAYVSSVCHEALTSERDLMIVYTSLHGTGVTNVVPVLERAGFRNLSLVTEQANPDGDFPHVKNHIPNPEEPAALEAAIEKAKQLQADLVLATDPDADRLGVAVPKSIDDKSQWITLTGNHIGVLLCYFIIDQLHRDGKLSPNRIVAKTLVTTQLIDDICAKSVSCKSDLLVGFKYIASLIEGLERPELFLYGTEESHGFLKGVYTRDKDGAVASLLMAEFTAYLRKYGKTPYQFLDELYKYYGYYKELLKTITLPGAEGSRQISQIMDALRRNPPQEVGGFKTVEVYDYLTGEVIDPQTHQKLRSFENPRGDLLIFYLSPDGRTRFAVRPSGTEPKIKIYISAHLKAKDPTSDELARMKEMTDAYAEAIRQDITRIAEASIGTIR